MGKKHTFDKKSFPGLGSLAPKNLEPAPSVIQLGDEVYVLGSDKTEYVPGKTVITGTSTVETYLPTQYQLSTWAYIKKLFIDKGWSEETIEIQKNPDNGTINIKAKEPAVKKMAKPSKNKPPKAEPIFQWAFVSGKEVHGVRAVYTTLLRRDNTLTCNCPGWVFWTSKKKGKSKGRSCKHTDTVLNNGEAESVWKKFKNGSPLPKPELMGGMTAGPDPKNHSKTAYGRVIEI